MYLPHTPSTHTQHTHTLTHTLTQGFALHIVSTACEWGIGGSFLLYFLTFHPDFKQIRVDVNVRLRNQHFFATNINEKTPLTLWLTPPRLPWTVMCNVIGPHHSLHSLWCIYDACIRPHTMFLLLLYSSYTTHVILCVCEAFISCLVGLISRARLQSGLRGWSSHVCTNIKCCFTDDMKLGFSLVSSVVWFSTKMVLNFSIADNIEHFCNHWVRWGVHQQYIT